MIGTIKKQTETTRQSVMEPLVWVLKEVNKGARRGGIKAHLGNTFLYVSQAQGIEVIVFHSDCLIKSKMRKDGKKDQSSRNPLFGDRGRRIDKWDKTIPALGRESKQQWEQSECISSKREWLLAINPTVRTSKVKPEVNPLDLAGGGLLESLGKTAFMRGQTEPDCGGDSVNWHQRTSGPESWQWILESSVLKQITFLKNSAW